MNATKKKAFMTLVNNQVMFLAAEDDEDVAGC